MMSRKAIRIEGSNSWMILETMGPLLRNLRLDALPAALCPLPTTY
jgi:hypothetical protein